MSIVSPCQNQPSMFFGKWPRRDFQATSDALVFPGRDAGRPLSDMSLTAVLRRMGRGELTAHGFRSSFRDWAAETTAYPTELVEMALAHAVGNKVEAAYRRGDFSRSAGD